MAETINFVVTGENRMSGPFSAAGRALDTVNKVARITAVGVGVLKAALTANAVAFNSATEEMERFARIANTSTEEFQRLAFGAEQFGVDSDKLSDILKDVNDRVGDFVQTGGGPMLDFFEQIGPKVGVTAESFKDLSGAQSLELYISSLEKANVSQADMTFFLEAMASDLTHLQPLFENGGEALERYGDTAERLGLVLDQQTIANSKVFTSELRILGGTIRGVSAEVGSTLTPVLTGLFKTASDSLKQVRKPIAKFFDSMVDGVFLTAAIFRQVFDKISKTIRKAFSNSKNFDVFVKNAVITAKSVAKAFFEIIPTIGRIFHRTFELVIETAREFGKFLIKTITAAITRQKLPSLGEFLFNDLPDRLAQARAQFSSAFDDLKNITFETAEAVADGTSQILGVNVESARKMADEWRKNLEVLGEVSEEGTAKAEEHHQGFVDRLQKSAFEMISSQQDLVATFSDDMAATLQMATEATGQAIATAIVDGTSLAEAFKNVMKAVLKDVLASLIKLGVQRLLTAILFKTANAAQATSETARIASSTYGNAFSSTAAIPVVGPALAPAAAATALAAVTAGMSAAAATGAGTGAAIGGIAHGGLDFVPREQTFLLDKGERVLSPNQNKDLTGFLAGQTPTVGTRQQTQTVTIGSINIDVMKNATNPKALVDMDEEDLRENIALPIAKAIEELQLQGFVTEVANRSTS